MSVFKEEFHGCKLIISDDGNFQNDDGKTIEYKASIKIQVGTQYLKISAIQLAGLLQACRQDDVREELQARFRVEKAALEALDGF